MSSKRQQPIWTKSFISISLTHFMVFMAFYTLLTTLPVYVINNLKGTEAQGGLIVTVMLAAAILIRPFSGKILEKLGKKKGLIISVFIFSVTMFFYMWVDHFMALLLLRFLHGVSFGLATTATGAIAADIIPPERRGEGLGYFAMAMNLAVVAGPFAGLTLLQFFSFQTLFLVLSIVMVTGAFSALAVHIPVHPSEKTAVTWTLTIKDLVETKALPIALISSLVAFSYSSVISFISVYATSSGLAAAASYFFLVFAAVMLASRPYLGRAFDVRGANFVIIPCLSIFAAGLIVLSFAGNSFILLTAAGLIGLGYGALLPSFQTMAIQAAPASRSGHATATFFMLFDSGIAAGSFVWGIVVASFGFQQLYITSAIVLLFVIGIFYFYQISKQRKLDKLNKLSDSLHFNK